MCVLLSISPVCAVSDIQHFACARMWWEVIIQLCDYTEYYSACLVYTKQYMPWLDLDTCCLKLLEMEIFPSFMVRQNFTQYVFSKGLGCAGNSLQN